MWLVRVAIAPPAEDAVLSEMRQPMSTGLPLELTYRPPPLIDAEFSQTSQLVNVGWLERYIPPPKFAEFPTIVQPL